MPDAISGQLRGAFRDLASSIVLRDIDRLWEGEGFTHGFYDEVGGQRVSLWRAYEAGVQWSDADHVRRVLRVYEVVLSDHADAATQERLKVALQRDGYRYGDDHRIVPATPAAVPLSGQSSLRSAEGMEAAFTRIELLTAGYPAGVVAGAGALHEGKAKTGPD